MNRFNFTLTAVALGFAIAATPALAAKDTWVDAKAANKTFNEHTNASNNRNARTVKSPGRKVGFKPVSPTVAERTPAQSTSANRSTATKSNSPRKAASSGKVDAKAANKTFDAHTNATNKRNARTVKSPGRQVGFKEARTTAQSGSVERPVTKGAGVKAVRNPSATRQAARAATTSKSASSLRPATGQSVASTTKKLKKVKGAKSAAQIRAGKNVMKSVGSVSKVAKGAGVAGAAISVGFLTAKLIEQEANDPGKTWRDLKSGNIAKSTVYDTVDLAPGGFLITGTAKIIDQEATDPGKTMRDINSGLGKAGNTVDRVGLGMNKTLGLSANPGDTHILDYATPVGAGMAIGRNLKSGRIQSDLRKTGADIKKVGTDIDRHANGVKNDVKKATASVGKKVDGVFKGIFK